MSLREKNNENGRNIVLFETKETHTKINGVDAYWKGHDGSITHANA